MKCEKCGGKTEHINNHRKKNTRTLDGIKTTTISQLKCIKCGHYSSTINEYAPRNMSVGYDVIDLILERKKNMTSSQIKRMLEYRYNFSVSISTVDRIYDKFGKKGKK